MKLFLFLSFCCCLSTTVFADVTKNQCEKDARNTRQTAITTAQSTYQDALTSCRGPCFEACKNTFETCVGPFRTAGKECVNAAEVVFATSLAACQTSTGCVTPKACFANRDFQLCLVDPRVLRRTTVQACNKTESDGVKAEGCFAARKTCNKACEPKK